MSRMGCYCGASMSNVNCPSENVIYVMRKKRVEAALAYDAKIRLIDFLMNWDERTDSKKLFVSETYDYWYCTECKRVYRSETVIGGAKLAVYMLSSDRPVIEFDELLKMEELIIFTNVEEDMAIEVEPNITLDRFIRSLGGKRYFMSKDEACIYAYDCVDDRIDYVYRREAMPV